jgi:hypothetical protein
VSAAGDEFYDSGVYDDALEGDYVDDFAPVEELGPIVDESGQQRYASEAEVAAAIGPDWRERWAEEDRLEQERVQAEHEAALAANYADQRLGQLTRSAVEEGGLDQIHLPALHDTVAGLLGNADWAREHDTLEGEPLIAAALADAVTALSPASDEFDALRKRTMRMAGHGLTVRGTVDDG